MRLWYPLPCTWYIAIGGGLPSLRGIRLFSYHSVSTERIHYPYANIYEIDLANKYPAVRLASGPVLITLANNIANKGLYIAATFLLNVGVIPLLLINFSFVLIMKRYAYSRMGTRESARVYISVLLMCSQDHRQHQRPGSGQALQQNLPPRAQFVHLLPYYGQFSRYHQAQHCQKLPATGLQLLRPHLARTPRQAGLLFEEEPRTYPQQSDGKHARPQ